jgi:hypothetical protein
MRILLLSAAIAFPFIAAGQIRPAPDYHNKEVKEGQGQTNSKVLRFLEKSQVDSALACFDSSYANSNPGLRPELQKVSAVVSKVKPYAKVSEGLIVYFDQSNVYRNFYYHAETRKDYIKIDLFFSEGNPASKVMRMEVMNEMQLKKMRKANKKASKTIPPPPPVMLPPQGK